MNSVDEGLSVDVIFLEAFDKISHQRLLEKLEKHGIGGRLLAVIGNWLQNRRQRVCIKGIGSSWINVCSGVP